MNDKWKNKWICILFVSILGIGFLTVVFTKKETVSLSERRKLASKPKFSIESYLNGSYMRDFEAYAVDGFPKRDSFRRLKTFWERMVLNKKDHHKIYKEQGHLVAMDYPYQPTSVKKASKRFSWIIEECLTEENKVYYSVIPDKNYFLAEESEHLMYQYEELVSQLNQEMNHAKYIDLFPSLEIDDYYKTDTHWKQENLLDVSQKLLKSMGIFTTCKYEKKKVKDDFYGVYAGQSALPVSPDHIQYLVSKEMKNVQVYDMQNKKIIPLYDLRKAKGKDPYEMFVGGALSLVQIKNPSVRTQKRLVLFRDSFGSSIAPLLLSGYQEIILVDIRYLSPSQLKKYIDFTDQDILFLYSTYVLNHSETIK